MIDLQNISASYGTEEVLSGISLSISAGETVALIGANGAGKTTLLKVISGAMKSRGKTLVEGRPVRRIADRDRAAIIAVVPQNIDAEIPLEGYDFVMLGRTHRLSRFGPPTQEDRDAVREAMERTETLGLARRSFREMSGGERQRLALAMAFAARPRIILLDEATAHLVLHHRAGIMELLREMNSNRGVTVIMAVHDLPLAGRYFDRLVLLKQGRILKDGPPSEALTESNIEDAYGCPVKVVRLPDDLGTAIVPLDSTQSVPVRRSLGEGG